MAQSKAAALLAFMAAIAFSVSSRVGGSAKMERSSSAGGGSSDGVKPLSLLSSELKKPFHSSSSSCSFEGACTVSLLDLQIF